MPPGLDRLVAAAEDLRSAQRILEAARGEMRAAIVAAYAEGVSIRDIARAAELSPSRVHQIITGRK